jgi:hypothetical protein
MPEHDHAEFVPPAGYRDPLGRPVDVALLGRFVGAAWDGCPGCQAALLERLVTDSATTARLVELACVAIHQALGRLPANLVDDAAPGLAAPEFRRLVRAARDGVATDNADMFAECARMSLAERRAAAVTAVDLLVGNLTTGS